MKRWMILILTLVLVLGMAGCSSGKTGSTGKRRRGDDPFEGLYYTQSREDVIALLGDPDTIRRPTSAAGNSDIYDTYENAQCCGYKGVLTVYYTGSFTYETLTVYTVEFKIANISEKERTNVPVIFNKIKEYYSGKYTCTGDYTDTVFWDRGHAYISNANEQIRLYRDTLNLTNPISVWLIR